MRIFITGGAGFIGSHLCDTLFAQNNEITILDDFSTGSHKNISHLNSQIKIIQGDIRNQSLVESLIEKTDLIFHLAASVGVYNILNDPIKSASINFSGSLNVLDSASKYRKRVFIASTSEIYGKNFKQPLSELDDRVIGMPQNLRWIYSDAKALEEAIAFHLFLTQKLRVTTLRFFNTVGPRQTGEYGMVIPRFISAALKNEPITVFGDGLQTRVFCHVSDTINAIMQLVSIETSEGEVFNIGGVREISILDLAKMVIERTDSKSEIRFLAYNEAYSTGFEEMYRRVPDISKIKNFVGWVPKLEIEDIIDDIAGKNYKNLGQP